MTWEIKKNLAPWARIQTGFNRMALQESVIHSVGVFKFVGIDEYILIIFIGPKIDEYKLILANFYRAPMNIRAVGFGFDRTTIFVSEATSPMNIGHVYSSVTWRTDKYMRQIKVKPDGPKICRCHTYILRPD
jgi:hypothetical protein